MNKRQVDPRVMIFFVLALSTASVVFRDAWLMLPVLLSALLVAIAAKAPVLRVLRRLLGFWLTLVLITALQVLFHADILTGLLVGATILQRLMILMLGGTLLARYPGHMLVQAMLQLRLPCQLAFMVSIGLRFVPLFGESYRDSLNAMQLRGVELRKLKPRARLRVYTYLLMPTIASGVHSARKLAMAMELRGFSAHDRRTSYAPLHMRKRDWLAFAAVWVWLAGLVAWHFAMRNA